MAALTIPRPGQAVAPSAHEILARIINAASASEAESILNALPASVARAIVLHTLNQP